MCSIRFIWPMCRPIGYTWATAKVQISELITEQAGTEQNIPEKQCRKTKQQSETSCPENTQLHYVFSTFGVSLFCRFSQFQFIEPPRSNRKANALEVIVTNILNIIIICFPAC